MDIEVERLTFHFPDTWFVIKFDDTKFYRQQFSRMWQPIKSVDLVAVSNARAAFLIEVKDYRVTVDAGPSELPQIVAQKVFDTLAAQVPCRINANEELEQLVASKVCRCESLSVVLHLEEPTRHTGLFRPYNVANLQMKLRQLLRPIHAHPQVLSMARMGAASWSVS